MALLYYTTEYSPDRAQAEIQKLLLTIGARRISLEYSGSSKAPNVEAISFTLAVDGRGEQEYMLPARVDRVRDTLKRQGVLRGSGRQVNLATQRAHGEAVAWRTLLEWLKVQAAMIETEQAEAPEVMLPYMLLEGERGQRVTVYEQFAATPMLPAGAR